MSAASAVERLSVSPIGTISPAYPFWASQRREPLRFARRGQPPLEVLALPRLADATPPSGGADHLDIDGNRHRSTLGARPQ